MQHLETYPTCTNAVLINLQMQALKHTFNFTHITNSASSKNINYTFVSPSPWIFAGRAWLNKTVSPWISAGTAWTKVNPWISAGRAWTKVSPWISASRAWTKVSVHGPLQVGRTRVPVIGSLQVGLVPVHGSVQSGLEQGCRPWISKGRAWTRVHRSLQEGLERSSVYGSLQVGLEQQWQSMNLNR